MRWFRTVYPWLKTRHPWYIAVTLVAPLLYLVADRMWEKGSETSSITVTFEPTDVSEGTPKPVVESPTAVVTPYLPPSGTSLTSPTRTEEPVTSPVGTGIAGEWQFEARVYKGINSSGVRFSRGDTYPAEVEIDEHGRGIFDGSPMIGCAIGPIEITRAGDAVSWVLDCKDKCEGSQRVFKGKLVDEGKGLLLEGEQKPVGPPTSPGCWLPYEELTGRRIRS